MSTFKQAVLKYWWQAWGLLSLFPFTKSIHWNVSLCLEGGFFQDGNTSPLVQKAERNDSVAFTYFSFSLSLYLSLFFSFLLSRSAFEENCIKKSCFFLILNVGLCNVCISLHSLYLCVAIGQECHLVVILLLVVWPSTVVFGQVVTYWQDLCTSGRLLLKVFWSTYEYAG